MPRRKLIVAGALGLCGRGALEHFAALDDRDVVGLSRRAPDFECDATFVGVDLRDRASCERELAAHADATHIVYAALYERPQLAAGWFDPEHTQINLSMLRNLLDVVESPRLEHVSLLQGTKAYGAHLGEPIPVPARESAPRVEHENFYFAQEDFLRERQRDWRWAVFRPQIVTGVATRSALNAVGSVGAYAAILCELGQPLSHPGHAWSVSECTDAHLIARAIEWAIDTPAAHDEIFNICNGDVLCWRDFWPRVAEVFDMELGEPAPRRRLRDEMPGHADTWRKVVAREGLVPLELDELIGLSWQYADMIWANPSPPGKTQILSTIKARTLGFADCVDSEYRFVELLEQMRRLRYLP